MKRILILNYEYPPLGGGAGNALYYMLQEFKQEKDLSVDVIASSAGDYVHERIGNNINLFLLDINKKGNIHYQSSKDLMTFSIRSFLFAKRKVKEQKYDLCHAFFGIPCGFVAMILGVPYIVSLRGTDVPFYNKRFSFADKYLFQFLSKIIWNNSEAVIANSLGLKDLADKIHCKRAIDVIPNGIDAKDYDVFFNEREDLKFLCVSRLIKRKGIDVLLKAFSKIRDKGRSSLSIVGLGKEKEDLVHLCTKLGISHKVDFKGYIEHSKLPAIYKEHDVFVLPSENEGMSNAVLEAMASGLPIIMTITGGSQELLGDNGIVVEKNSPEQIKEAMQILIDDRGKLRLMGKASRERAEKLSWKGVAEKYITIYNGLTDRPSR